MHRASSRFWTQFENLPDSVQKVARKNFELLKDDPRIPRYISRKWESSGP
jgi:hypothetical protein